MTNSGNKVTQGVEMGNAAGKSMAHLQAELMADKMFTDMMASAGVPVNRMQMELMYFIPRQFRDAYIVLFRKAMKGDDSDAGAAGLRNARVGELGRSAGKNDSSGVESLSAEERANGEQRSRRRTDLATGQTRSVNGSRGKKYKKYWTIEDERAFELKELVDKRLRGLAREIQEKIAAWD